MQGYELRHHFVFWFDGLLPEPCFNVFGPGRNRWDNLYNLSGGHRGIAMHLQDRFKDLIGLLYRNLGRRDDGHFSLNCFINDEVFTSQLTYELDKEGNIHIVKIDGYITII